MQHNDGVYEMMVGERGERKHTGGKYLFAIKTTLYCTYVILINCNLELCVGMLRIATEKSAWANLNIQQVNG